MVVSTLANKGVWRHYTTLDGLVHDFVRDIHSTPDGMLWFATEGGVSHFDGQTYTNFTQKDGLAHNWVNTIHQDDSGALWFGTANGISLYDGREFVNLAPEDGWRDDWVNAISQDVDGVLWFGTADGVLRYDGKTFLRLTTEEGLADDWVNAVHCASDGALWFGTWHGGVSRHEGGRFVTFTTEEGLAHNGVHCIHAAPDGNLWFGTEGGVAQYDRGLFVVYGAQEGLADDHIYSIHSDQEDVLWFGTWHGGVSRHEGDQFVTFTTEEGLAHNSVHCIHATPDGNLWFGTENGVSCYNELQQVTFTTDEGLAHNNVKALHYEPTGALWIGTEGGLSRYEPPDGEREGALVTLTTVDGLVSDNVQAIHSHSASELWVGTADGVSRYDGQHFRNLTQRSGLVDNDVYAIHCAPEEQVWFGTRSGISRYDGRASTLSSLGNEMSEIPSELTTFTTEDGLAENEVRAILRTPDGTLWFGTRRGGVSRYDGMEFTNIVGELIDNEVWSLHCSSDGKLWIGAWGTVAIYDGQQFTNLTEKDGLASYYVYAISQTPDGVMWFGTKGGVFLYDGTALTSLGEWDGLASKTVRAIATDENEGLWFGTEEGLTYCRRNRTKPRVRITAVTADRHYTQLDTLEAIPVGSHITFEYCAIDFNTHPNKRLYRHKLVDHDEGWSKPGRQAQVGYADVPVGEYVFHVQAIDRNLNYSEPATLSITISPNPQVASLQTEVAHLRHEVGGKYQFEKLVGLSTSMKQVRALMERAIDSGLNVLVSGETGTGKELVANAIHYNSPRKDQSKLALNCGGVPKELVASTLFGHRKGAFTGAIDNTTGLFESADGGAVILDEIGEMPLDVQPNLLRVLEEHRVQRLGEYISREIDVRVIAITNRDLLQEISAGRFRQDLYYRLNEFPIHIPPLRERLDDILLLSEHFYQEACHDMGKILDGFALGVVEMLQNYLWPGNVRELRNEVRRACALVEEGLRIQTYHFSSHITRGESLVQEVLSEQVGYSELLDRFRRRLIEEALRECDGNRSAMARQLGMDRSNLVALMKRLGIVS